MDYWSFPAVPLEQVAQRLRAAFELSEPDFDAENLYEWFTAEAPDGTSFNVSRQHHDGAPDFHAVLRLTASGGPGTNAAALGLLLARALGSIVFQGTVHYRGGDAFEFVEASRFEPAAPFGHRAKLAP